MLYINGTSYTNNTKGKVPQVLSIPDNIPDF